MSNKPYLTAPVPTKKMPGGIPFIIGNEAAERFSFYGMKGILVVFMSGYLHLMGSSVGEVMPHAEAREYFHHFTAWVYLTPLLGALLSDAILGKYHTILWLSIVYCIGHGALAFMGAVGDSSVWLFWGLMLISLGAGGIKPCVSAHVGDQFGKSNGHLIERVFNYFYFAINVGAFVSQLLTPWFLEWYGPHVAFGVPGALMAIATFLFWCGRHRFIHIQSPMVRYKKANAGASSIDAVKAGLTWLKSSEGGNALRESLWIIAKLGIIYVFVAVFWALFDQTGSSWPQQAQDMDRQWLGITWLKSQIQAINPIMILTFVPLFTFVVYPAINKVWTLTPMRKISVGLFLMIGGFALVAHAQGLIDQGQRPSISWQVLAYVLLTASEVMVSITCLEYSYTQAPRRLKSLVMAAFFASVSLGNFFTAGVNHYTQIESGLANIEAGKSVAMSEFKALGAALPESDWTAKSKDLKLRYALNADKGFQLVDPGLDGSFDTVDDIRVEFEPNGARESIVANGLAQVQQGVDRIQAASERVPATNEAPASIMLPLSESGQASLSGLADPWGKQLSYSLLNSVTFRVSSDGADQVSLTPDDVGVIVTVFREEPESKGILDLLFGSIRPETRWIDRRKAELGIVDDEVVSTEEDREEFSQVEFIGGQNTLEGASYFWFFTILMAATAVLFVIVALLYPPPQTYLQDEAPLEEQGE